MTILVHLVQPAEDGPFAFARSRDFLAAALITPDRVVDNLCYYTV